MTRPRRSGKTMLNSFASLSVLQVDSTRCRRAWSWTAKHQSAESSWSNSWTSWSRWVGPAAGTSPLGTPLIKTLLISNRFLVCITSSWRLCPLTCSWIIDVQINIFLNTWVILIRVVWKVETQSSLLSWKQTWQQCHHEVRYVAVSCNLIITRSFFLI